MIASGRTKLTQMNGLRTIPTEIEQEKVVNQQQYLRREVINTVNRFQKSEEMDERGDIDIGRRETRGVRFSSSSFLPRISRNGVYFDAK